MWRFEDMEPTPRRQQTMTRRTIFEAKKCFQGHEIWVSILSPIWRHTIGIVKLNRRGGIKGECSAVAWGGAGGLGPAPPIILTGTFNFVSGHARHDARRFSDASCLVQLFVMQAKRRFYSRSHESPLFTAWHIKPSCDRVTNLVKYYLMLGGNERRPKGDAFGKLSVRGTRAEKKKRQWMKQNTTLLVQSGPFAGHGNGSQGLMSCQAEVLSAVTNLKIQTTADLYSRFAPSRHEK